MLCPVSLPGRSFLNPAELDVGVRTVMQGVAREVGRDVQIELSMTMADITSEQVGAAAYVKPQLFACFQLGRRGRQAKQQLHRLARDKRFAHTRVDCDFARG